MGVFRPFPNAPLALKREMGALPTLHLPLVFRRDGGVSTTPQCPPRIKTQDGGISTHPTPPSRISTRWGCFDCLPITPRVEMRDGGLCTYPHTSLLHFNAMGGL